MKSLTLFGAMCFEGNIDFYGKSGFTYASEFGVKYHDLPAEEFDKQFPPKKKEKLPGQIFGLVKKKMNKCVIYIHGKGGNAVEAEHYKPLFSGFDVIGLDYQAQTPWEAKAEFANFFAEVAAKYGQISIIANSIGAFFTLHALPDFKFFRAYFISPIVNMEHLIENMMNLAGINEAELKQKGIIQTEFGETLSWKYLNWVRNNRIKWHIPTHILYGSNDNLQSLEDIKEFAAKIGADVTVMEGGEHWFHTEEQMQFLDNWIIGTKQKTSHKGWFVWWEL